MDADTDLERAHALADGIEREFLRDEGVTLTIHIDPVRRDDPLAIEAQNALAGFLSELSEELSAHDFPASITSKAATNASTIAIDFLLSILFPHSASRVTFIILLFRGNVNPSCSCAQAYSWNIDKAFALCYNEM